MASADRFIKEAEQERAEGKASVAALSLLKALSLVPTHERARASLAELVDATPDPERLIDPATHAEAALALGAFCAERRGAPDDALAALLALLSQRPLSPFATWAEQLLRSYREAADPSQLVSFLGARLAEAPGVVVEEATPRRALEALIPLTELAARVSPQHPGLLVLCAALLRKAGRSTKALALAKAAEALEASWKTAIGVAMAHRARGELSLAIAAYERALEHDPDDLSARLDVADMLLEHHRLEDASLAYQRVLDSAPEHPWATPSLLYVDALLDTAHERAKKLADYATQHRENARAASLTSDLRARKTPFIGYLPTPRSQLLPLVMHEPPDAGVIDLHLSALEPPSALIAVKQQLYAMGQTPQLSLTVGRIPARDPRMPRAPVRHVLWEYEGIDPRPIPPRPHAAVSLRLAALAGPARPLSAMWQAARTVAIAVAPRAQDLLGVMVHPTPALWGRPSWGWIQRLQVAAAFTIARLPGTWAGSFRQEALTSIAWGVSDWTVEAALCALARLAHADPEAAESIRDLFRAVLGDTTPASAQCFDYALVCNALFLPNLTPDERRRLLARREAIEQRQS
jgi:tetratricopeptide (TPR) repeat protein